MDTHCSRDWLFLLSFGGMDGALPCRKAGGCGKAKATLLKAPCGAGSSISVSRGLRGQGSPEYTWKLGRHSTRTTWVV
jgi:hypothetical protein